MRDVFGAKIADRPVLQVVDGADGRNAQFEIGRCRERQNSSRSALRPAAGTANRCASTSSDIEYQLPGEPSQSIRQMGQNAEDILRPMIVEPLGYCVEHHQTPDILAVERCKFLVRSPGSAARIGFEGVLARRRNNSSTNNLAPAVFRREARGVKSTTTVCNCWVRELSKSLFHLPISVCSRGAGRLRVSTSRDCYCADLNVAFPLGWLSSLCIASALVAVGSGANQRERFEVVEHVGRDGKCFLRSACSFAR